MPAPDALANVRKALEALAKCDGGSYPAIRAEARAALADLEKVEQERDAARELLREAMPNLGHRVGTEQRRGCAHFIGEACDCGLDDLRRRAEEQIGPE